MTLERIQKILSNAGVASRREAEELMLAGRVAVNGQVVTTLGSRADPEVDEITVDGVPVNLGRYRYFALNKPRGIVTTTSDEQGRDTVLDLVPIGDVQLHPVGRLDMDSEGLLIITNDGHLTNLLTHPRYEIEKEYLVGIDRQLSETDIRRIVRGVESEGERLRATSARIAMPPTSESDDGEPEAPAWVLITLREGKNREIRRMMEALGREVRLLRRIRIGPLHLGDLQTGSFRELTETEVQALYAAAKQRAEQEAAKTTPAAPLSGPKGKAGKAQPKSGAAPRTAPAKPPQGQRASERRIGTADKPGANASGSRSRVSPPQGPTALRRGASSKPGAAPQSKGAGRRAAGAGRSAARRKRRT